MVRKFAYIFRQNSNKIRCPPPPPPHTIPPTHLHLSPKFVGYSREVETLVDSYERAVLGSRANFYFMRTINNIACLGLMARINNIQNIRNRLSIKRSRVRNPIGSHNKRSTKAKDIFIDDVAAVIKKTRFKTKIILIQVEALQQRGISSSLNVGSGTGSVKMLSKEVSWVILFCIN